MCIRDSYEAARAGVAVSDSPTGPYRFVSSSRVCPGIFPLNMTEEERDMQWKMCIRDRL